MATDLLSSSPMRQNVRRCLFGKPKDDEFMRIRENEDRESYMRFKRKWNWDDEDLGCVGDSNARGWIRIDSDDIPEYYRKGYARKCKRRALTPCVGKQLDFIGDSEDHHTPLLAVQYVNSTSTVEVFLRNLSSQQPPSPPSLVEPTPLRSTTPTQSTSPPPSPVRLSRARSVSQPRLTDWWPIRKRARSLTPDMDSKRSRTNL